MKILLLVGFLAVVTAATAGFFTPPPFQDVNVEVECNMSRDRPRQFGDLFNESKFIWAEFPVNPGVTEVTVCRDVAVGGRERDDPFLLVCKRTLAAWLDGTTTGFVDCGLLLLLDPLEFIGKPVSITVHN